MSTTTDRVYKRLEYNNTYEMYVVQIIENRKGGPVSIKNEMKYVHDILFVDNENIYYKPEYLTNTPTQNEFIVGQKAKFICTLTGRCDEITPVAAGERPATIAGRDPMHVGGTAYSQALTLATQIKCAECTSLGKEVDLKEVFLLASEMEDWLMDKKSTYS